MKNITIRPARDDDLPQVVELLNQVNPPEERVTLDEFMATERLRDSGDAFHRLVAVDEARVLAVSWSGNSHNYPPHKFRLWIAVTPDHRRRGIGTAMETRQRAFAAENGGTEMAATIPEDDQASRAFLERFGYSEAYRRFAMELDVRDFDWSRYAGWRSRLGDLRLITMADAGADEETLNRLFDLAKTLSGDVPFPEGTPEWRADDFARFAEAPGFRPDGLYLAVDGDRWAGMSGLLCPEGRPAYTYFTGVRREYRGRGLATTLKLATIEFAREHGFGAMRTTNDTVNAPMVAINEKLGYRRLPARVTFKTYWQA